MSDILALQRAAIAWELARVEAARQQLPPMVNQVWAGEAHMLYSLQLAKLHSDAAGVAERLRDALTRADRALATVASW